ncbi:MAG: hypothetical protein KKH41_00045 [Candidatus Thermoplasmatota archaeon]|nr:hypothetical protein [Euryarchaeota archaeon]MBU4070623.1 hypothetical protein [Candidatus Thermoplasmatota archaeon]MBU4145036.1 hypothetical protein [Candidatus Thermoplasmatota archaeon]MBU4590955.1 hypothetical protein [Candidatus Thermoplasmatota archaeon]
MAEEDPNPDEKKYVPAPSTGLGPMYFTGTATRSDVPYSKNTKIAGAILVLALILFMAWFIIRVIMQM